MVDSGWQPARKHKYDVEVLSQLALLIAKLGGICTLQVGTLFIGILTY